MVQVGNGTVGNIEMQDLLFTSAGGSLSGLILVYWQISAATQGSVAMWGIMSIFLHMHCLLTCPQTVISALAAPKAQTSRLLNVLQEQGY